MYEVFSATLKTMNVKKNILVFVCCSFTNLSIQAQSPVINSLREALTNPKNDSLSLLFSLCKQGSSLPSDSFMHFAQMARAISLEKNDFTNRLWAEFYIGKCYVFEGKADSGLLISEMDMKQVRDIRSQFSVYHQLWWLKISCLTKLRKFDETFAECYKMLESGEKYGDLAAQVLASNAIGSAYFNFSSDFVNAKKWWMLAYQLAAPSTVLNEFPQILINLSYLYYGIDKNIDSAQFFLSKAFAIAEKTQSLKVYADCYSTQADIDNLENKPAEAEKMLQKGLQLYKQIGNTESILEGLTSLIDFYTDQKNYAKAILYGRQTEEYLNKSHSGSLTEFYRSEADIYEKVGNYVMADSMLHKFIHIQDSLYTKNKVEDLVQLETKYQLSSKEAFIASQKLELLRKDILIGGVAGITILIAAGGILLFRRYRRNQIAAFAEAEEKERKRIAADLHDNIGAYAAAISAGIDEIESKKLVSDDISMQNLKNNATEMISSLRDTIWAFNKDSVSLTGISDRLKTYIQKMQPAYPQVEIRIEENISTEKRLSPAQALHIFRIVQEALHNALQHSRSEKVRIDIESHELRAKISITDDGDGFDPSKVTHTGNGLLNMKSRAAEADFELRIEKNYPKGTKVILTATLRK